MEWQRLWSGPANTIDYIKAFMHRAMATETRYRTTQHMDFVEGIDLTTVYNCETLISALKLINSHKQQISCKNLQLESHAMGTSSVVHSSNSSSSNANHHQVQMKVKSLKVRK